MFTANCARNLDHNALDDRIECAVKNCRKGEGAYLRVYREDPWLHKIREELSLRGFTNIDVPDISIKGDVYFEWSED